MSKAHSVLLTYPRTGSHWLVRRLLVMAEKSGFSRSMKVTQEHAQFHPKYIDPEDRSYKGRFIPGKWDQELRKYEPCTYQYCWYPDPGQKVYALIRNARQVVVSNWYWLKKAREDVLAIVADHPDWFSRSGENYHLPEFEEIASSLEAYAEYGTKRYVKYLNWLNTVEDFDLEDIYCYEDMDNDEFIMVEIPRLLRLFPPQFPQVTADMLSAVRAVDAKAINSVGADHDSVPQSVLSIIDSEIQACELQVYRDRYL